jgi:sugar phosphate isomerase/epimerase
MTPDQPPRPLDVGVVTDEVSNDLAEALDLGAAWGITRFELREGAERRFPFFRPDEVRRVEDAIRRGGRVTAVSPGLFKGAADDEARLRAELEDTLPRSLELAVRFACPVLIVFGFARYEGEPAENRRRARRALARAADAAAAAGLVVAIENEPDFWVDRPRETAALLAEVGHPALRANWDPANLQWGGCTPSHDDFAVLRPFVANVHVKDYAPSNPARPWPPVGQGEMAWPEMLRWIAAETDLAHVTLETHCLPKVESSRQSLEALRSMVGGQWPRGGGEGGAPRTMDHGSRT